MPSPVFAKFTLKGGNNRAAAGEEKNVTLPYLDELCYFNVLSTVQRLFSIPTDVDVSLQWCGEGGHVTQVSSEEEMRAYLSYVRGSTADNDPYLLNLSVVRMASSVKELQAAHEVKMIRPTVIGEMKHFQQQNGVEIA